MDGVNNAKMDGVNNAKPVLLIETVWNDENEKLTNQVAMSDYSVKC
mgnify:CR=1 FL=1